MTQGHLRNLMKSGGFGGCFDDFGLKVSQGIALVGGEIGGAWFGFCGVFGGFLGKDGETGA